MIKEIPTQAEPQSNAAKPLLGKVAVITGSSKGIGRGFALELARRGAKVLNIPAIFLSKPVANLDAGCHQLFHSSER